ncbi:MAG: restriction endonuclease subunit S [Bacteroidaceae bacterium]|nr:restriction endonuclease subunit S [Bacteroidaceae bacterium]
MSKAEYKRLGDYIRTVDIRNRDEQVTNLLGVSVSKEFMPSIANTIGTDMSVYKIVERGQFVYIADTSRRGDKIAIALLENYDNAIVSQAYTVFEVIDHEQLLPEYLMMWFRRPEFDRYARFHSHGSAREIFDWEELCDVMLPVPSITRQREIVSEYETLTNRTRLNNQMIQHLEDTAQALYRKMFVEGIDKENLPEGWRMGTVEELAEIKNGKSHTPTFGEIPIYGGNGIVGYTNEYNAQNVVIIGRVGINCGSLYLNQNNCYVNDNAMMAIPRDGNVIFLYMTLMRMGLNNQSEGSGQPLLTQAIIYKQECVIPKQELRTEFENKEQIIISHKFLLEKENIKLTELQSLLLAKMGQ